MKIHIAAIFLGFITDLALSIVGSLVLFIFGIDLNNPSLYIWSLILGLIAISVGGYVTAYKAKSFKMSNVVIFGILGILIGLLIAMFTTMPLWFHIASFVLIIPAAMLGAYIEIHTVKKIGSHE